MKEILNKLKSLSRGELVRRGAAIYLRVCQVAAILHLFVQSTADYYHLSLYQQIPDWLYNLANFLIDLAPFTNTFMLDNIYVPVAVDAMPMWVYYIIFAVQLIIVLAVVELIIRILSKLGEKVVNFDQIIKYLNIIGVLFGSVFLISLGTTVVVELMRGVSFINALQYSLVSCNTQQVFYMIIAFVMGALVKEQKTLKEDNESLI